MLYIDVTQFFDFETADEHMGYSGETYYDVLLVSKSTGEVMTFTFDRAHFDELLNQMKKNIKAKKEILEMLK